MASDRDVIHELTADHHEVEHMFEEIDAVPSGDPERKRLVDALTVELVRLTVAEEDFVHPAVREHVADGKALVDHEVHELGAIERTLKELELRDADDPEFDALVEELKAEVGRHEHHDEESLFVELQRNCSEHDLDTMGDEVRNAMAYSRNRPHVRTADTPPEYELLTFGSLRFLDRLRALIHPHAKH
jgi:hypothetical protein